MLLGWRGTTVDVDLELPPEQDAVLRAIPRLKEELSINVELASPGHFFRFPQAGTTAASRSSGDGASRSNERDHARDREDLRALFASGLVEPGRLLAYFEEIEPALYRFPAIDATAFRRRVAAAQRS